ncbi:MAG TPA: DUF3187 domain-containing protein [Sulfuricurvum sp.]|nr:DUF3187 domain-containing protein [Sulfuricurvum sp.]
MQRILPILFVSVLRVFALDNDLDGVDNTLDKCNKTPFGDLVDEFGCSTKTLFTDTAYDIIVGANYSDTNYNTLEKANTLATTLQADVYRGNMSAQISSSYYRSDETNTSDSGWNDTQLGLYIKTKPFSSLTLQPGFGVILPTYKSGYDNEAIDLFGSINAQYDLNEHYHVFGGFTYTFVNDKSIPNTVQYQNTSAFTAGVGYATSNNGFINGAYTQSKSIYTGVETFKTLSLNGMIPLDKHWFLLGNYRYGLSDSTSDNEIAVRIGYYF